MQVCKIPRFIFRVFIKQNYITTLLLLLVLFSCKKNREEKSLMLYCAAGMKPVVEVVANNYLSEYGVRIDIQYGGSGTLLSNLRVAQQGDLYLAADSSYIKEAQKFKLINETQPLSFLKPIIAVPKGNPKRVKDISSVFRDTLRIAIANPDAASIGRLTKKMFQDSKLWDSIQNHLEVQMPTVNEVANAVKLGTVDAGIIWDATANQYEDIDVVDEKAFNKYIKTVTLGVLKFSKEPTEALKFLRYLSAKNKGLEAFRALGYHPIEGDVWEESPELLFYSGGVNRLAADETINAFETREGIKVTRVYNGCGILVSQIKAGQNPDAYLTCDVSFMEQVKDKFTNIMDISNTRIVIVTKKENPKQILGLSDLAKKNIELGVCNDNQSALGALTKQLLKGQGLWEAVYKNVRSQAPTADLLVNQILTGSLDAVIVYYANVSKVKDRLEVVSIDLDQAIALQNIGVAAQSNYKYLTKRLINALMENSSKDKYLEYGFGWEYTNPDLKQ